MTKTYTYTARSLQDPARAMTFTLHDHHLTAELALPPEEVERSLKAVQQPSPLKPPGDTDKWIAAVAEPLEERGDQPFALDDIDASANGEELRVTAWSHAKDDQLQPIVIAMDHVDNPAAAAAFADEINRRKLARPAARN